MKLNHRKFPANLYEIDLVNSDKCSCDNKSVVTNAPNSFTKYQMKIISKHQSITQRYFEKINGILKITHISSRYPFTGIFKALNI